MNGARPYAGEPSAISQPAASAPLAAYCPEWPWLQSTVRVKDRHCTVEA
jgi:hypothetical protein